MTHFWLSQPSTLFGALGCVTQTQKISDSKNWVGYNVAGSIMMDVRAAILRNYGIPMAMSKAEQAKMDQNVCVIAGDSHVDRIQQNVRAALENVVIVKSGTVGDVTERLAAATKFGGHLVLSVGSNDIANGKCPESLACSFATLLQLTVSKSPDTKVSVMAIPLVANYHANFRIKQTNRMIQPVCVLFGCFFCENA